jgi:hypothetical protein
MAMRILLFVVQVAFLALVAGALAITTGHRATKAAQSPSVSLDMVTSGNTYDETTNTMSVGPIDSCLSSGTANTSTHSHNVHVVINDVEDLIAWEIRMNYIGDHLRPNTINFTPFTDNNTGQNISFVNLPIDSSTGVHRDLVGGTDIPPAPPDGSNTAQTAFVGSIYVGTQNPEVSADTPPKTVTDGGNYEAADGGVVASLSVQVIGNESGQSSLSLDVDDHDPNSPGSHAHVFTDSGMVELALSPGALGDGFHGEGTACIARLPVDTDGDGILDHEDPDVDGDGVSNEQDLCPLSWGAVDEVGCSIADVDFDRDTICDPLAPQQRPPRLHRP